MVVEPHQKVAGGVVERVSGAANRIAVVPSWGLPSHRDSVTSFHCCAGYNVDLITTRIIGLLGIYSSKHESVS